MEGKIEETKKYWEGFPEAPASDSFKWVDENGFEHLSTVRAWSFSVLLEMVDKATSNVLGIGGRPAGVAKEPPKQKIQLTDELGTPVVNAEGEPEMVDMPAGVAIYTVAHLFHDKTKNGKDTLKVCTVEPPYNKKYGVNAWGGGPDGWIKWPVGVEHKYMPPKGFEKVIIRDPDEHSDYPNVEGFRPA